MPYQSRITCYTCRVPLNELFQFLRMSVPLQVFLILSSSTTSPSPNPSYDSD